MSDRIAWDDFTKFVRQLCHDVRNQLNAVELQAALVSELTADASLKGEVSRLRQLISQMGGTLQHLSTGVAEPRPMMMPYSARDLMEDLKSKIGAKFPEHVAAVEWKSSDEDATIEIDPMLMEAAIIELFENAFRHGGEGVSLSVESKLERDEFIFLLSERNSKAPKDESILREPLRNISHGHYGLGRRRVGVIVAAQGGRFETERAGKTLVQRIVLPCSPSRA